METVAPRPVTHPAKFNANLMPVMARMLAGCQDILDPFAGVGKIFELNRWLPDARIEAVEIEPEWAVMHPATIIGNALDLPWEDQHFDAICTSPAFGNRMADVLLLDRYQRNTYANGLGRELHADSGAKLQWGEDYRRFHFKAWEEARRVLKPGGVFVLNIKDHIRDGQVQKVTSWHATCLDALGFEWMVHEKVMTTGNGFGANGQARVPYENVIKFILREA